MAHLNIDERRLYVQSKMGLSGLTRIEIKEAAAKFGCSYSAITADIAMINRTGGFTIYPGKGTKIAILKRDKNTCQYCLRNDNELIVDHVIPVSMGGVGYAYNLVAAYASCNSRKCKKVWVPLNIDELKKLNPNWFKKIITLANK